MAHWSSLLIASVLLLVISLIVVVTTTHAATASSLNTKELKHHILLQESNCNSACIQKYQSVDKCLQVCADLISDPDVTEDVVTGLLSSNKKNKKKKNVSGRRHSHSRHRHSRSPTRTLSDDANAEQQQLEATKRLYQLFHNNLRTVLTNGGFSAGFQLYENAIDLTDIRAMIPGWESMPLSIINRQSAQDYDNMAILTEELIQSSKPGPFRITDGTRFNQEYEQFLSGVLGVSQVQIPNPDNTLSVHRTKEFEYALNNCTIKYMSASPTIIARYSEEQYSNIFCPEVRQSEQAMFAQIGIEAGSVANNKAYAAAVALGMARGLFTMSSAFKKYQSFRAMEYECLKAQDEDRPLNGNAKSISFSYDHHNWRNTQESSSFSVSAGYGLFKAEVGHSKTKITGLDLTAIGGVEIAMADFKYVPLYPGEWYSSTILNSLRYELREPSSAPLTRYFGTTGTLTLVPKALYVVNNPTISFFVKTDQKTSFMQKTETAISGGLSVFGINFGGNYGRGRQVDSGSETSGNTKISIISNSCRPQLFAVDHHYTY